MFPTSASRRGIELTTARNTLRGSARLLPALVLEGMAKVYASTLLSLLSTLSIFVTQTVIATERLRSMSSSASVGAG